MYFKFFILPHIMRTWMDQWDLKSWELFFDRLHFLKIVRYIVSHLTKFGSVLRLIEGNILFHKIKYTICATLVHPHNHYLRIFSPIITLKHLLSILLLLYHLTIPMFIENINVYVHFIVKRWGHFNLHIEMTIRYSIS